MKKIIYVLAAFLLFTFFVPADEVKEIESIETKTTVENTDSNDSKEIEETVILPFNANLTEEDKTVLDNGEVLIKSINYAKYMSLNEGFSEFGDKLRDEIYTLKPKYLAEIIQYKPYKGNEDLPQRLEEILNNVSEYAGIPYFSERHQMYFPLYDSAEITDKKVEDGVTTLSANLVMQPFGNVEEKINILKSNDEMLYLAINQNQLKFKGISAVGPNKLKMCILLFREGDNWILYGIGGVNAPRVLFLTERIETSFINRIKTFCNFIFEKF